MTPRQSFMLAAMAATPGRAFSPVQVQKLFFLIDKNVGQGIGGPLFAFRPYNYGPFDRAVYDELENLASAGSVEVHHDNSWRSYRLTEKGQAAGELYLGRLDEAVRTYVARAADFVLSLSFTQLVAAIYRAFPEMKANSVFQE